MDLGFAEEGQGLYQRGDLHSRSAVDSLGGLSSAVGLLCRGHAV